jgi:hypothetical protein
MHGARIFAAAARRRRESSECAQESERNGFSVVLRAAQLATCVTS